VFARFVRETKGILCGYSTDLIPTNPHESLRDLKDQIVKYSST
jgi:hypothetical protein